MIAPLESGFYPLLVNYKVSVEKLIRVGKYYKVDPAINSQNFPRAYRENSSQNALLITFGYVKGKRILEKIREMDLRPGDLCELLSFGYQYPDEQLESPIVAVGSRIIIGKFYRSPLLNKWGPMRKVSLYYLNGMWKRNCRFLCFQNEET